MFFDIECCNGRDICEFGYVLTDAHFNVLERDDITINPGRTRRFVLGNRAGTEGISLYYSEDEYRNSPIFPRLYRKIRNIIKAKDRVIVGHSMNNDAFFLRKACERYGLPVLCFDFYDTQRIYSFMYATSNGPSLESAAEELGVEKPEVMHRSDEDSMQTMGILRAMCDKFGKTPTELFDFCLNAKGYSRETGSGYYSEQINQTLDMLEKFPQLVPMGKRERCIETLERWLGRRKDVIPSALNGKRVCFGIRFERENTRDCAVLVRYIIDRGGKCNSNACGCHYFVASDGDAAEKRYRAAAESRRTEIISYNQLLDLLGVSDEKVKSEPVPHLSRDELDRLDAYNRNKDRKQPVQRKSGRRR